MTDPRCSNREGVVAAAAIQHSNTYSPAFYGGSGGGRVGEETKKTFEDDLRDAFRKLPSPESEAGTIPATRSDSKSRFSR